MFLRSQTNRKRFLFIFGLWSSVEGRCTILPTGIGECVIYQLYTTAKEMQNTTICQCCCSHCFATQTNHERSNRGDERSWNTFRRFVYKGSLYRLEKRCLVQQMTFGFFPRVVFRLFPSLFRVWIQDGARLIKLCSFAKIHLRCRLQNSKTLKNKDSSLHNCVTVSGFTQLSYKIVLCAVYKLS